MRVASPGAIVLPDAPCGCGDVEVPPVDDNEVGRLSGAEPVPEDEPRVARLVLVPRTAGPLRPLDSRRGKQGDDLDVLIDEAFGPSTNEGPGPFDVALVVIGLALLAWSWIGAGTGPWIGFGIGALVLGLALPTRSLFRVARARRIARREQKALATGLALDVSDARVAALAGSYEALLHAATLPGVTVGLEAVTAGHAAVLEVASLLGGRPPLSDEELAYVDRRSEAIGDLTAQLAKSYNARGRAYRNATERDVTQDARERAAAVAKAREELESTTGVGAVQDLERLRLTLGGGDGHDA
jgi:hypothetical protein